MKRISKLTGSLAVLATSLSLFSMPVKGAEVKNVTSEIEGDTQCIQSAERYFYTWMDYNNTIAETDGRSLSAPLPAFQKWKAGIRLLGGR